MEGAHALPQAVDLILSMAPETFERIQGLRRKAYDSADYLEGKNAFFEKRKPHFKGEIAGTDSLNEGSSATTIRSIRS